MGKIKTAFGMKQVVRRFGAMSEYYETVPTKSAPNGEYWTHNAQLGFVPVPSNGRALQAVLAESK
jgi:hypothetical protein